MTKCNSDPRVTNLLSYFLNNYVMDMSESCVTCGKKSQDYDIECPCCGNYYCSDQCSRLGHSRQFVHHQWTDYKHIHGAIMSFDPKVRVVTICDLNGEMMYSGHREGVKNLLTAKESKESLELAVKAWKVRGELAPKIGKGKYVLAEYEKVKRLTLPLGNDHILYITTELECDHAALIAEIQKLRL